MSDQPKPTQQDLHDLQTQLINRPLGRTYHVNIGGVMVPQIAYDRAGDMAIVRQIEEMEAALMQDGGTGNG